MAEKGDFRETAEAVRGLEGKALQYVPYGGEVSMARTLELEPRELADLAYADMLNMYERTEKIRSTVAALKPGEAAPAKAAGGILAPSAAIRAVETKLQEMTAETLKRAEEVARGPLVPGKHPQAPEAAKGEEEAPSQRSYEMEIEFEHKAAEEKPAGAPERKAERAGAERREMEEPAARQAGTDIELEMPGEWEKGGAEKREEAEEKARKAGEEVAVPQPSLTEAGQPAVEVPMEKKLVIATVPPALRENPDEAAARKYGQMEAQVEAMLGGATDEVTIKKKMLELTKELFKEKSFNRREQLKMQISVMKNLLTSGGTGAPAGGRRRKAAGGEEAHGRLLDTIVSTQQAELAQTKDSIIDSYNRQIGSIRKKFYDDIGRVEESAKRKAVFDAFVFSVTSLVEQLPGVIRKYQDYTVRKHSAELEKLLGSLGSGEKATSARAGEQLEHIRTGYAAEFAPVKGIIGRQIEALIDSAGSGVFEKGEGEREDKRLDVVAEISATDDGTLLAYLQSRDAAFYARYERKEMSRAEATARAKTLLAKEKGLSEGMIRKYFSETGN